MISGFFLGALLYGLNSHQAVDSYRQIFDITGSFKASLIDKTVLEDMLDQIKAGASGNYGETVGGSPELEMNLCLKMLSGE